jgi:hypothetical protein
VLSAGGIGVPGQTVTFTIATGGGSIAGSPQVTDANGFATSGAWTLGPSFGTNTVVAQTGTFTTTFTAVVDPCEDRAPLAVGQTVTGTLDFGADKCAVAGFAEDRHSLTTANGAAVNITLASTAFDAFLKVGNATASVLIVSNDDASSSTTNSALKLITAASTKTVTATSKTAGQTGAYSLSVASTSSDVTDCSPVYLEPGVTTTQTLSTTDCRTYGPQGDVYTVYIPAGGTVRITMQSNPLDALFWIYSPSGVQLRETDSNYLAANETTSFTAPTAGFYKIVATSFPLAYPQYPDPGHDFGAYFLTVIIP